MAKKLTQKAALLKLLLKGKPVTDDIAREKCRCRCLRSRISDFIKEGFKIDKEYPRHTTIYKTSSYHAVYTLDLKHAKKKGLIK